MEQFHTIKDVILWLLAILGTWSFFKDVYPWVIGKMRRWRSKHSFNAAQQEALRLAVDLGKLSELRDPQALRIHGIFQTSIMIFLAILSTTLVGIGLFQPGQHGQEFASLGGLFIAMIATSFLFRIYHRMKCLRNLDITTEVHRARILELGALYPMDETLQHVQRKFDELYPKPVNLPTDPTELRKLWRGLGL